MNEDGFSVTECLGGSMGLDESELGLRYQVCFNIAPHRSSEPLSIA